MDDVDAVLESEAELIEQFLVPLTDNDPGAFGLADDCACLSTEPGMDLVLTTDSLVEGVHFFSGDVPGFKALAVNVSDLVAKGAEPVGYLLTLALPKAPSRKLMTKLTAGLALAQEAFGVHLLGGDTDRTGGPLTLTVAAIGRVPKGGMVRRGGAVAGDIVYVSGTIGDAHLGLSLRRDSSLREVYGLDKHGAEALTVRFEMPRPPLQLIAALRGLAHGAMDVSDGLAKDFVSFCRASGCGGEINLDQVPVSAAAARVLDSGCTNIGALVAGGEDYEVLAAVPPAAAADFEAAARSAGVKVTAIGRMTAGKLVRFLAADGTPVRLAAAGWDHLRP